MKTIIHFYFIKLSNNKFAVDTNSIFIFGKINLDLLNNFFASQESLSELEHSDTQICKPEKYTLEVWEDSADDPDETWLDFKVLADDYELPFFQH